MKTVSLEEQLMSKHKISKHMFAPNGEFCVYHPSNLFRSTRSFENWGIYMGYCLRVCTYRLLTKRAVNMVGYRARSCLRVNGPRLTVVQKLADKLHL